MLRNPPRVGAVLRLIGLVLGISLLAACASNTPATAPTLPDAPQVAASERRTIALLGATGMVGGYLLQEALARGHNIRALARTPAKLDEFREHITIVQGDARDREVIRELLRGSDVVINALGPVKADGLSLIHI